VTTDRSLACWCGSARSAEQFRTRTFGLVRCTSCGCYRIDPPPIGHDGEAASFYSHYYERQKPSPATNTPGSRSSRFWEVVRQEPSLAKSAERVADIGCGEGHLCQELRDAGWSTVIGLDVSRTRIERARRRYPFAQFYDRPIEETGVALASLDLIIMDNVVEHLPDPVGTLRTLKLYLKPGGRIVLITPNMKSGHFRLLGRRWTPELAPHAHIYLFTPRSMGALLSSSGLAAERVGNFHLPTYPFSAWASRLLSADVKGAVWRAVQEMGGVYGRLTGSGPMLYAVARRSAAADIAA
jgi:SAM-dependent methyltransferase